MVLGQGPQHRGQDVAPVEGEAAGVLARRTCPGPRVAAAVVDVHVPVIHPRVLRHPRQLQLGLGGAEVGLVLLAPGVQL